MSGHVDLAKKTGAIIVYGPNADASFDFHIGSDGEVFNVGTGIMTTMEDIALTIGGKITFIPKRNFEVEAHQADMSKTIESLNWKHRTEVIQWLKNFVKEN